MKRNPAPFSAIRGMIDLDPGQEERFRSLFTAEVPPAYQRYEGPNIRMRYFGHACILIETREVSILVDPLISYYGYLHEVDRFSDVDLPDRIDYVLITHNHQDHILFETLLPLRHKIGKIIVPRTTSGALQDPNLKLMFRHIGFENVIELGDMEKVAFRDCDIMGIPFIGAQRPQYPVQTLLPRPDRRFQDPVCRGFLQRGKRPLRTDSNHNRQG